MCAGPCVRATVRTLALPEAAVQSMHKPHPPRSLRSATSPPRERFGTCSPYPCPRGSAAPSRATLR